MGKIYDTQDYLRIQLAFTADVEDDIASAVIKYIDPDGIEGEWVASIDTINKTIYYELPQGSPLEKYGLWTVWSVATMDDGRTIPGTIAKFKVFTEGT